MYIEESLMEVNVYYKKPGADFYLVQVSFPDVELFINSIIVAGSRNNKGLYATGPKLNYRGKTIKQVEFGKKGMFWSLIEPLVLQAVEDYQPKGEDFVAFPTEEEMEQKNLESELDKAIDEIFNEDKPP